MASDIFAESGARPRLASEWPRDRGARFRGRGPLDGRADLQNAHPGPAQECGDRSVFSPDGGYLFSGGWDRQLICWDMEAMRRAFSYGRESDPVQFRKDGNQCAILVRPRMRLQFHAFDRPTSVGSLAKSSAEE